MNEYTLQLIAVAKLLWVAIFAGFYGFGGISNKWLRRYVGSAWMLCGTIVFSLSHFKWWYLLYSLLLCASLHIGYGATETWTKIRKRLIYGMALGCSAGVLLIGNTHFVLYGFHVGLCCLVSVVFGVLNPTGNARSEETLVGFLSTVMVLFLI